MRRLKINPRSPDMEALREAAGIVAQGGIAVYPTETVYGLGVLYNNAQALERLFAAKARADAKPVLLLIESLGQLAGLAAEIPPEALELAGRWWPGPLTMLFRALPHLLPHITGAESKVACRISGDPVARHLVHLTGSPITSTSANPSGCPSPARAEDLAGKLLEKVDVLLDAGATPGGPASTLIDVTVKPFRILREGAIPSSSLVRS